MGHVLGVAYYAELVLYRPEGSCPHGSVDDDIRQQTLSETHNDLTGLNYDIKMDLLPTG